MIPLFTKIIRRKSFSRDQANSVKEIIHAREVRESRTHSKRREIPFVVKYFREPIEKVRGWEAISRDLVSIGVPAAKLTQVKETSIGVYAKQKDYSNSLQTQLHNAREFGKLTSDLAIKIVLDMAKMHKRGYVLSAHEHIFAPWIIYKKPNGESDRVIVDYGSVIKHDSPKFIVNGKERSHAEQNISTLLPSLVIFDKKTRIKIMETYFSINPDPTLKSTASTFMEHHF